MRGEADVYETGAEEAADVFTAEAVTYSAEAADAHWGAHGVDDGLDDGVDARSGVAGEPGFEVELVECDSGEIDGVAYVESTY